MSADGEGIQAAQDKETPPEVQMGPGEGGMRWKRLVRRFSRHRVWTPGRVSLTGVGGSKKRWHAG